MMMDTYGGCRAWLDQSSGNECVKLGSSAWNGGGQNQLSFLHEDWGLQARGTMHSETSEASVQPDYPFAEYVLQSIDSACKLWTQRHGYGCTDYAAGI